MGRDYKPVLALAILIAASGLLLFVVTSFAILREDPTFWLNAGGWPIWLRQTVFATFYPLLGLAVAVLLLLTIFPLLSVANIRLRLPAWTLAGLMWLWFAAVLGVASWNNVQNVIAGRPIHWHPGQSTESSR